MRGIKRLIDLISVRHDFADGTTEFTRLDISLYGGCRALPVGTELGCIAGISECPIKIFADEISGTACDVDVFADQITVDARHKVVRVKVNVFNACVEFGGNVVPHPFRVHAKLKVAQRRNASPAALGHFFTAHGDEAMYIELVWDFSSGKL